MTRIPYPVQSNNTHKAADNPFENLDAARRYLRERAAACLEGAQSDDPRVVGLALALTGATVRPRRCGEVYELTCHHCRRHIEIAVTELHRCRCCHAELRIEWRAAKS
jgi:hypothetical protein